MCITRLHVCICIIHIWPSTDKSTCKESTASSFDFFPAEENEHHMFSQILQDYYIIAEFQMMLAGTHVR